MKRARRGIVLGVLALLGGAVVTVLVAEGIGLSGVVTYDPAAKSLFITVADRYAEVRDSRGTGWRYFFWMAEDQRTAATNQYRQEHDIDLATFPWTPSDLHCDPPTSLPRWARLWRSGQWPKATNMGSNVAWQAVQEFGVGWPMEALSMDRDSPPPYNEHGGMILPLHTSTGIRLLLWRPIFTGFVADTFLYAACLAGIGASVRLFVRARRKRRGACAGCGYDLKGLVSGAACPECGRAEDGAKVLA